MQSFTKYALGLVVVAGFSMSASGAWVDPVGGWQINYEASSEVLPDATSPAWVNDKYTGGAAQIVDDVNDEVSGTTERTMRLDNNSQDRRFYIEDPYVPAASGTDLLTLDLRFRLVDTAQSGNQAQLRFIVIHPTGVSDQRNLYLIDLAFDQINYSIPSGANSGVEASLQPSDDWHDLRWHIDVASNVASVYLDGSATPLFSHAGVTIGGAGSIVEFGDNSGSIQGIANLSYLRITNQELAAVPEPAGLGLLAASGLMLLRRRTHA